MIHRLGPAASRQPEHLTRASHRAQAMSNLLHHHLGHDLGSFWIMSRRPARGGSTSWTRCWGCSTYKDPQLLPEGVGDGV